MDFDEESPRKEEPRPRRPRNVLLLITLIAVALVLLWGGKGITGGSDELKVTFAEFLEEKKNGKVKSIKIEGRELTAVMHGNFGRDGKPYTRIRTDLPPAAVNDWVGFMKITEGISEYEHKEDSSILQQILLGYVPWIFLILMVWFFFFRQMRSSGGPGNILAFGKSRAKFITPDKVKTTFADVAGVDEAKDELGEIVEFLRNPQKFTRLGGRIPRGMLLVGSPGTGKTLLAKAIAGEAGVPFLSICGSDFVEMFVGVGASRVRDLFQKARENSPCIIFLDEIDAVGRRRGTGLGGGHDEREQTLNQILVEMDGFDTAEGIIMLASTNRPDVLDPALLRPGRFDRLIHIDLPDVKGRDEILRIHARKIKLGRDVDLKAVARATPMCSGADLASIVNEAAILATMRKSEAVETRDFQEARDKVLFGRQKKSRVMDEKEKEITAAHEAGHTLITAKLLSEFLPLHKVTIIPRGRALGMTMAFPDKDRYHLPKEHCLRQITMCFGGRVAEEIVFGEISAGAADDIKKATDLARRMVCEWGMTDALGPVNYAEEEEHLFLGREIARTNHVSEETQRAIDAEVRRILDHALQEAREIVTRNRSELDAITQALIKYETLTGDEVRALLRGESIDSTREREEAESRARQEKAPVEEKPAPQAPGWKPERSMPGPQQA